MDEDDDDDDDDLRGVRAPIKFQSGVMVPQSFAESYGPRRGGVQRSAVFEPFNDNAAGDGPPTSMFYRNLEFVIII